MSILPAPDAQPHAHPERPVRVMTLGSESSSPSAVDLGFGYGLLQRADGDTAAVLFGTWGYEDLCLRRTWRMLAEQLAAAGLPTLRFDPPGQGDALDGDADAGFDAWVTAARVAIDRTRAATGCTRVVLVGLGLGAVTALAAADGRDDLAGLVLAAPVQKGKRYAREVGVTARMMNESLGLPPPDGALIEIGGFSLPARLTRDIKAIDLAALAAKVSVGPAPVLVLERPDAPIEPELAGLLGRGGAEVSVVPFEDWGGVMTSPVHSVVPTASLFRIVEAARRAAGPRSRTAPDHAATAEFELSGDGFVERPVAVGPRRRYIGVSCRPTGPEAAPLVVFTNTGRDHRGGWARTWTDAARGLARAGFGSLRFDMPDIGDSPADPGHPAQVIYSEAHVAALTETVDALAAETGRPIVVAGLCSGAYLAFHAATRSPAVTGAVLVNTLRFVWDPDESVEQAALMAPRPLSDYRDRLLTPATYRRILAGEIAVGTIVRRAALQVGALLKKPFVPLLGVEPKEAAFRATVRDMMGTLTARGTVVRIVCGTRDGSLLEVARHFGSDRRLLARHPNASFETVPDTDHNMSPPSARAAILAAVLDVARRADARAGQDALKLAS